MIRHPHRILAWAAPAVMVASLVACDSGSSGHHQAARSSTPTGSTATTPAGTGSPTPSATPPSPTPMIHTVPKVTPITTPSIDTSIGVYADCLLPLAEQKPSVEPPEIVMACADNGFGIGHLHWTSWTASSATGTGTTWYKECKPDCARGRIIQTPQVHVTLTQPVRGTNGAMVWSQISFSQLPPGYPPGPQPLPIPSE